MVFPLEMNEKNYLWVWNPKEKAPHVGVSVGESYFHSTIYGSEIRKVELLKKSVIRQKKPLLLIEITSSVSKEYKVYFMEEKAIGNMYDTCLAPIKLVFSWSKKIQTLHDVFNHKSSEIASVLKLNLFNFNGLSPYNLQDVYDKIQQIKNE